MVRKLFETGRKCQSQRFSALLVLAWLLLKAVVAQSIRRFLDWDKFAMALPLSQKAGSQPVSVSGYDNWKIYQIFLPSNSA
ncbi:MAG: hypothetical protein DKT66_02780 [Candidatus Melainabacteria bacterium]|nr:MAG: hypothetical protein DKT66_02780 [Candidatus Melainabacteria bacterium]